MLDLLEAVESLRVSIMNGDGVTLNNLEHAFGKVAGKIDVYLVLAVRRVTKLVPFGRPCCEIYSLVGRWCSSGCRSRRVSAVNHEVAAGRSDLLQGIRQSFLVLVRFRSINISCP